MINEEDFIRYLSLKQDASANTIRHCKIRIRVVMTYLLRMHYELDHESIASFIYYLKEEKKLSNAGINTYILCIRYLEYFLADKGLPHDLLMGIKSFKKIRQKPIDILTQKQVEDLLAVHVTYKSFRGMDCSILDDIYNTLTMTLAFTGARYDEAVSLLVKYINLDIGKISFPDTTTKNKLGRSVYITEPLIGKLKKLIYGKKDEDLVFTNMMGKKIRPQEYQKDLKTRAVKANIAKRCHPHLLRHTYATNLYIASKDIGLVQLVLGHKDIKSTMIYIHLADDVIKSGMMQHPFIRRFVDPLITIRNIEKQLSTLAIDMDTRFRKNAVRQLITDFITGLYGAVENG